MPCCFIKKSDDNMSGHACMKDKDKIIKNKRMKNLDLDLCKTVIEQQKIEKCHQNQKKIKKGLRFERIWVNSRI